MNIEHGLFHLFESLSFLRNSKTKPASGEVSPEVENKLPKPDYSLLTSLIYFPLDRVVNATPFRRTRIATKNGIIGLAVLCMTIPVMLVAQPAEKKTLVGVWEVKISAGGVPPPPLLSIAIFGWDGSFTTTGNTKISLAPPFQGLADQRGPGYGRWAQTGNRDFKLTFYAVLWKEGEVNGYMHDMSMMKTAERGRQCSPKPNPNPSRNLKWPTTTPISV